MELITTLNSLSLPSSLPLGAPKRNLADGVDIVKRSSTDAIGPGSRAPRSTRAPSACRPFDTRAVSGSRRPGRRRCRRQPAAVHCVGARSARATGYGSTDTTVIAGFRSFSTIWRKYCSAVKGFATAQRSFVLFPCVRAPVGIGEVVQLLRVVGVLPGVIGNACKFGHAIGAFGLPEHGKSFR